MLKVSWVKGRDDVKGAERSDPTKGPTDYQLTMQEKGTE